MPHPTQIQDRYGLPLTTRSTRAAERFIEGLDLLLEQNFGPEAQFTEAIEADTGFALAYSALAYMLHLRAQVPEGRECVQQAEALAPGLSRREQQQIEAIAPIVQVDIDPLAIGRYFPVALGVVADAGTVAGALADLMEPAAAETVPWHTRNAQFREERLALLQQRAHAGASTRTPLHPDRVYAELRQVAPRDALFTLDAGTTGLQATDQLPYYTVPALLTPLDCGMIGFSYAAGLGAKVAAPQRTVMSLMGDGGFGMTMGEMATAVMHNIATIAIVMDNGTWGSEIAYQRDFYNQRYIGAHVLSPRFDEVMKLCGGNGYFATEPGDTADAVRQAMQDGKPAVIHVKVNPDAVLSFRRDALQKRG